MEYLEFSFKYETTIDTSIINDILASQLGNIDFESFISNDNGLLAYIAANKFQEKAFENCLNDFPLPDIIFHYNRKLIEDIDWNEEWEKNHFKPIRIGKECLIRAFHHPEEEGFKYQIIINPKKSFGTGSHATTHLMLNEILKADMYDKDVLDMGCGTAVLSILAEKKGAKNIVAIDIDEWAYNNSLENCKLNNTKQIKVALGGAEQINSFGNFDYIFANINRNILLADIKHYSKVLKSSGILYMSGFYKEDIPIIEKECMKNGLSLCSFEELDNWVAIKTQKDNTIKQ